MNGFVVNIRSSFGTLKKVDFRITNDYIGDRDQFHRRCLSTIIFYRRIRVNNSFNSMSWSKYGLYNDD